MSKPVPACDATELAEKIRNGETTPQEILEQSIERIEAINPGINAVIHPLFEKARTQLATGEIADGPFHGVPLLVKDLLCATEGDPYHAGMGLLREHNWVAKHDSYLAQRFRQAGFIILGRTNTPELGASATTEPLAYGPTRNPWNTGHSTGGSSGGSAASVATGMVPVAHGNDMGGSIRIPASACGLLGLKPSRGRISPGPEHAQVWGPLGTDSVLTRSTRDLAAVLDVISGPKPGDLFTAPVPTRPFIEEISADPGCLRVGVLPVEWDSDFEVDEESRKAVSITAQRLLTLGHEVEMDAPPGLAPGRESGGQVVGAYIREELLAWGRKLGRDIKQDDVEPWTWRLVESGRRQSAAQYLSALEERLCHARDLTHWWTKGHDILLTPTMPRLPPELGHDPKYINTTYGRFTIPWNFSGQPALSLPVHISSSGLPVGVQLVAAYGREDLLIRLSAQLERFQPWPRLNFELTSLTPS